MRRPLSFDLAAARDGGGNQLQTVGTPTPGGDGVTQVVTARLATPISATQPRKLMRVEVAVR